MKKYFLSILTLALAFMACKKETGLNGGVVADEAYVSVSNFSASNKSINIYQDTFKINQNGALANNGTILGTYIGLAPGTRTLSLKDATTGTEYNAPSINAQGGKSYSLFLYDTLTNGKLKSLVLTTDRSMAIGSDKAGVRFLNLIPNAPAVDVWLFRSATDSLKIVSNSAYVGSTTPNIDALSTFTPVPAGTYTALRVRTANTNTNIVSVTSSFNLVNTKLYTFVARGLVGGSGGTALGVNTILQN